MIIVTARMWCHPGTEEEFMAAALEVISTTLTEPGCASYACMRDIADPAAFVFVEEWADKEALREHSASEHLRAFQQAARGCIASQEVRIHTVEKSRTL